MDRRTFMIGTAALGVAIPAFARLAAAQTIETLEIFVPAAPGGGWDQTGRVMDEVLRANNLIGASRITNVGGAGGTVGLPQFINQHDGEGDALMVSGMVMIGAIIANKSAANLSQVTPIARLTGEFEAIVVPKDSPHQDLASLVEALKADPQSVSWAGGSAGGTDHILAGLIAKAVGADPTQINYVAFAGGGEALASLLGNQVTAGVSGWGEFAEQVAAGNLRALAISAPERVEGIDVPTLKEQGVDVELLNWRGVFAPPNIDDAEKQTLIDMITQMVESDEWQAQLEQRNWMGLFLVGDEFAQYVQQDAARIEAILKEIGLA